MARWDGKRKARGSDTGILSSRAKEGLSGERNIKNGKRGVGEGKSFF